MFLTDHIYAFDQLWKGLVHERLANVATNISVLVHTEGFSPLGCW